jgi:hypothetical protein
VLFEQLDHLSRVLARFEPVPQVQVERPHETAMQALGGAGDAT